MQTINRGQVSHLTAVNFQASVRDQDSLVDALKGLGLEPEIHEIPQLVTTKYTKSGYDSKKTYAHIIVRAASIERAFQDVDDWTPCDIGFLAVGGRYKFVADNYSLGSLEYDALRLKPDGGGEPRPMGIKQAISLAFAIETTKKFAKVAGSTAKVKLSVQTGQSPAVVFSNEVNAKSASSKYLKKTKRTTLSGRIS